MTVRKRFKIAASYYLNAAFDRFSLVTQLPTALFCAITITYT